MKKANAYVIIVILAVFAFVFSGCTPGGKILPPVFPDNYGNTGLVPANNEQNVDPEGLILQWPVLAGADTYNIYGGPVPDGAESRDLPLLKEDLTDNKLQVPSDTFELGETYEWQIEAENVAGSALSNVFTFTTKEVPPVTVLSVEALEGIEVDYGTAFADLDLPETVEITLSDGATATAAVSWTAGTYDPTTAGTYNLEGELTPPEGVTNPDEIKARISVTVKAEEVITIVSVEALEGIEVNYGTAFADLDLPETVEVTLSDGATATAAVSWAAGTYDPTTAGTYNLEGELTPPEGVTNPDEIKARISVTVKDLIVGLYDSELVSETELGDFYRVVFEVSSKVTSAKLYKGEHDTEPVDATAYEPLEDLPVQNGLITFEFMTKSVTHVSLFVVDDEGHEDSLITQF